MNYKISEEQCEQVIALAVRIGNLPRWEGTRSRLLNELRDLLSDLPRISPLAELAEAAE